jgi:hypothetical protein
MVGDEKYGMYEGDDDYGYMRIVRDISMGMKGATIGA